MGINKMLVAMWAAMAFVITAFGFYELLQLFANPEELWQQRLIGSNIEYAMSLFFLVIITVWHGVTADLIGKLLVPWVIYRSIIFPSLLAFSLIIMIPFDFSVAIDLNLSHCGILVLWFLLVGDPFGTIGKAIAGSEWFRNNILKVDSKPSSLMFQGLRGWSGVAVLHFGLGLFYLAALLG